ncbi:polysaccharide deacetylase family protein [Shewanella sp. JM162201]|uniref:Polysaccharide deacetylase family protein n=1 Tax=Shewanella jiangmenensis TaxID=2837387 RepID=A0ABS5V428_9GAMM|nr:polysaccharide deacetylase family protein [Shewanella jiangmenensis]MBT1445185.1 polysaccharide deacetylase family protein [Shewanella jiangmenensis]
MLKVVALLFALIGTAAQAAVVMQYHHVSESSPRVTSVTPAEFRSHMQFLADNQFKVMPLRDLVAMVQRGEEPPLRAVAITFDDGYQNIADEAVPILKEFGFPYTLFVSIDPMLKGHKGMMTEATLKRLARDGAEIANHSFAHDHLIRKLPGETDADWKARIRSDLLATEKTLEQIRGKAVQPMLAYPFGEYNGALQQLIKELGMVAFGQQSGAMGRYSDLTAIPRFPFGGAYGTLESVKEKLWSLPLPVKALSPADPHLTKDFGPLLSVTLADVSDIQTSALRCFLPNEGAVTPTWVSATEFSVRASKELPAGRSRYNCTAPSKSQKGYYWFSQAWVRANKDGSWPKEP